MGAGTCSYQACSRGRGTEGWAPPGLGLPHLCPVAGGADSPPPGELAGRGAQCQTDC